LALWRAEQPADLEYRTYALIFPGDLTEEQVTAWVRSLSGTLRGSSLLPLRSSPTICLEVWADNGGLNYRLKVPARHAEYVLAQLRTLVPGIRVSPQREAPHPHWTRAVEVGMRGSQMPLRIFSGPDMAASLLASVQPLGRRETVLVQWVMTPAVPQHPPTYESTRRRESSFEALLRLSSRSRDAVHDQREKLAEPNMLAVLRVAVLATSEGRADQLLGRVRSAVAAARGPGLHLTRRFVSDSALRTRIAAAAGVAIYPIQLSAPEVAALIAWPIDAPHVAGLPQARSRHLPPSRSIARRGLVVARANFPGAECPLAVSPQNACKHLHLVGPTGVGKTALAGNLAVQAMGRKSGVIAMERKGDLFRLLLDAVPPDRLDDVIVLDVADSTPVGFNLLAEGNSRVAVEELCQLFEHLYPDMRRGIWARAALYRGLSTLITRPGMTFIDLVPLLSRTSRTQTEELWRDELIAEVIDPELARFWERFDSLSWAQQENYAAPVLDRVWQLNERPAVRNIIGQSVSSFSMHEAIRQRKIVLINLSGLGAETGRLAGTLLLNAIWSAVRSGAANPKRPTLLLLDEFQDFLHLPVDPESMLVQARSFGLAMVLAHQHLDQLRDIRSAVMANARSKVVFQATADDARVFAHEFGRTVTDEDFQNLGQFEVLCKLATDDGVSAPVSGTTYPPPEAGGVAAEVRERSRKQYGRTLEEIEADIAKRRTPRSSTPKRRPRLGGTAWDG
jgi:hypothetical protein